MLNKNKNQLIGGLVIFILMIIIWVSHGGSSKDTEGLRLFAQFRAVDGLREGSIVTYVGERVGIVDNIVLLEKEMVPQISLLLEPDLKIPSDSILVLRSRTIYGEKYADIRAGGLLDYLSDGDSFLITDGGINVEVVVDKLLEIVEKETQTNH